MNHIRHGLQDVEVEVGVTGDGAVQAGLEEGGPLLLQDSRRAASVVLADPGHPRKHHLTDTQRGTMAISVRRDLQALSFHL